MVGVAGFGSSPTTRSDNDLRKNCGTYRPQEGRMAQTPHEKYPAEGKSLGHGPDYESNTPVSCSTETPQVRKVWWRIRAAVKRPRRARRQAR